MSTPQGPGSNPPHGNQAGQPTEQASWGQPPPGGWGQQQGGGQGGDEDPDRTQRVDPRAWNQQVPPQQAPQQPQQQPQQQPYGGQQGWAGQQPPPQQGGGWGGPGGQQSWSGQPPPQQQNPYAPPQQQGWGGQQGGQQPQPTQQASWGGPQSTQQQPWGGQQQSWDQGGQSGYTPTPDTGRPPGKRSKLPFIIGGIVALLIAAAAVVLFWIPGLLLPKIFDEKAVATGVTTVLTRDYGLPNVTGVTCPANTSVKAATKFTCDATIDGDPSKVEITVLDNDGKYEVGRPSGP